MTSHLQRFSAAAAEFCAWCESEPGGEVEEARAALRFVARLYLLALELRYPEDAPDVGDVEVGDARWRTVYERFAALPFRHYASIFDPRSVRTGQAECETADLADDLADIHRDLGKGLDLLRRGHPAAAEWQWCWSFQNHWGRHAAGALRALHCWLADEGAW